MSERSKAEYRRELDLSDEFDERPDEETLEATVENIAERGIQAEVVPDGETALARLQASIPDGASVMTGHSTTLEQIGFAEHLASGDHDWQNRRSDVWSVDDPEERLDARRAAQTADYFLGSVNAVARSGELVAADASGSRIGAYPFAAKNLLLVSGTNKLVPTLEDARRRVEEYVYPLEDARAEDAYGEESMLGKELVFRREKFEGRTRLILVRENLGF
jgi:hypothetical protein